MLLWDLGDSGGRDREEAREGGEEEGIPREEKGGISREESNKAVYQAREEKKGHRSGGHFKSGGRAGREEHPVMYVRRYVSAPAIQLIGALTHNFKFTYHCPLNLYLHTV